MTRKDFQAAAEALADSVRLDGAAVSPYFYRLKTEDLLCKIFRNQNPRFDAERFRAAVSKALGE